MSEITATEAARNFADLLDAVEHRGRTFTIMRRGRSIAHLQPVGSGRGRDVRAVLHRHRPDDDWRADLTALRQLVELDERS
jgi:prevent-host-death family protein